ncbi:sn-glycerol-3-phosphate import ATP-binding protein UgpC [Achromobacter xylosoxidans]|uniref:ABC transporter ATP-binding protein n=1 Tax=Alcaligenes xylosoxydans xylosoxydans TaxID=85698 RepID=UPI0006C1017E|nr:ABC transporter ATP-binding protein [Achromobacter xylosoxidans]MDH0523552.1 ABC transporter ATP-binding protein [Achromobacter xylosoxidans]MDH0548171.1 ABC transporter ATP-binding protein [Achromobacter xylosoxidans]CUI67118.1 sn-glycerol-3-phosphate import ATP-binding protein UgpC [Achromobacter xylosoxidans]CUI77601.1 sn-glycerol-3-phosphate import ATP-binding protein UgpC [Achromobacter xylosoxidans]
MAQIELDLSHSYVAHPQADEDYALLPLQFTFRDGGAYALLGPSGCGKTTLLNCVSGLLRPSHGRILFDGRDVTKKTPQARNIAQVFQFPVVYDTMTVAENLAFPLRNRGVPPKQIRERVGRIAEMLEMSQVLDRRASGLTADAKQKISLGRGLVRNDVSAVLFDEPLTVIDPQLKWELRRKLKEIHHEFKLTLIYVTHDQTEALTFADQVMVMARGRAVQVGSADDLFERPAHTFVGHFIGSPGMNFLPAQWRDGGLMVGQRRVDGVPDAMAARLADAGPVKLGVRPEYLRLADAGAPGAIPATVQRVQDVGTYTLLLADFEGTPLRARLGTDAASIAPGATVWLSALNPHTCFYRDEELIR